MLPQVLTTMEQDAAWIHTFVLALGKGTERVCNENEVSDELITQVRIVTAL